MAERIHRAAYPIAAIAMWRREDRASLGRSRLARFIWLGDALDATNEGDADLQAHEEPASKPRSSRCPAAARVEYRTAAFKHHVERVLPARSGSSHFTCFRSQTVVHGQRCGGARIRVAQKQNPPRRVCCGQLLTSAHAFLRRLNPSPTKPRPRSASVAGAGRAAVSSS